MRSRFRNRRRSALLLEVVVALAIMVSAMGLMAAQLSSGLQMATLNEDQLRGSLLAERMIALIELDPITQELIANDELVEEEFGDEYPGYFWRVINEPVNRDEEDGLHIIVLEVLYQRDQERLDSIDDADVIRRLAMLKAPPNTIDLVADAGLPEETIDQIRQLIPIADFDPRAVNLQQIVAMDPEAMLQLLPLLQSFMGAAQGGGLEGLSGGDVERLRELQGQLGGVEGLDPDALDELGVLADPGQLDRGGRRGAGGGEGGGRRGGRTTGGGRDGGAKRGDGGAQKPPPADVDGFEPGQGSGPDGSYTIEDLMRLREEMRAQDERRGR
jgi:hypothetical protein